jgi:hypothetical protein
MVKWLIDSYSIDEIVSTSMYPDVNDPYLQRKISNMLEFAFVDTEKQILFPYQNFVRKYMSPYTPYQHLILYHSLGSGKTIATISVAIDNYLILGKKCCIVTKGISSETNFKEQIELYAKMSGKIFSRNMFFYIHYVELSNRIKANDDEYVQELFSNKTFIMDEIHNIKNIKENGTLQNICRGVSLSLNSKFLYLTATPMVDNSSEVISLLSLANRELSKGYDDEELRTLLNGIVSYSCKSMKKPKEKIIGNKIINGTNYYVSYMKNSQAEYYLKNYPNSKNVYQDIVQISLFCSSDGLYGDNLIRGQFLQRHFDYNEEKRLCFSKYSVNKSNLSDIKVDRLDHVSCIYKSLLDILMKTPTGKIFIFLEHVSGSGIIMLSAILEANGYRLTSGYGTKANVKSFTICVGDVSLCQNLEERLKIFNSDDNENGEHIQILIGSKIIGESINLKNVKQFHFISHHWNNSYLEQSKGRVIREKSHKNDDDEVEIYIHLSLLPGEDEHKSIDLYKLNVSYKKQLEVDHVKDIMIDCAIDKYINPNTSPKNYISFALIYAREYVNDITDSIFDIVIHHDQEYFDINDLELEDAPEVTLEMIRIIILYNITSSKYEGLYLRCSYLGLYTTDNIHWPFWDFAPCKEDNDETDFHDIESRIKFLENQDMEDIYEAIFLEYNDTRYHIMEYNKNSTSAYAASVIVPNKPKGLTKVLVDSEWIYVKDRQTEIFIFEMFEQKRREIFEYYSQYPFFGYVSIIDNEVRYKKPNRHNHTDKRKHARGMSIKSMKRDELINILIICGIYTDELCEKSKLYIVNAIENYMYENNLYCYI